MLKVVLITLRSIILTFPGHQEVVLENAALRQLWSGEFRKGHEFSILFSLISSAAEILSQARRFANPLIEPIFSECREVLDPWNREEQLPQRFFACTGERIIRQHDVVVGEAFGGETLGLVQSVLAL